MKEIKPHRIGSVQVSVPGSKSYTHRMLIASALSDGICTVENPLLSEDTLLTRDGLHAMGVEIRAEGKSFTVSGSGGKLSAPGKAVFLGNSGTSMRLLAAVAALCNGEVTLTGTERMCRRPIGELLNALEKLSVSGVSANGDGCPPIRISGGDFKGGRTEIDCSLSSQYLSGLLLIGPFAEEGLEIEVTRGPVSRPYIDMTVDVMARLGVEVEREGYQYFRVPGGQVYRAGQYSVEPDISNASYFWAAGAITRGVVTVKGVSRSSRQGDLRLLELFEAMGCSVSDADGGICVTGGPLKAIDADMGDMPDMVPTIGVVAAFAEGTTVIRNVAHLRAKESDRLAAVATELSKMGIEAEAGDAELVIRGGAPEGAHIDTYNDHRIAMSFAVAGLRVPDVFIRGEGCVGKSFPDFWKVFEGLYRV